VLESVDAGAQLSDASVRKAREVVEIHADSVRRAVEAGVTVAMGTDAGVGPHGDNLRELSLMRGVGMSAEAVLRSATLDAARLLGVDDRLGTLEVGKVADLVLVEGDALVVEDLTPRIRQVWKDGRRVIG
jgi:imidazolonepropionase-like amidohydrolase